MYFVQACWKDQKGKGQWTNFREFGRTCGADWRKMSPQERQPFQAMAQKDKQRYDGEMGTFRAAEQQRKKAIPKRPLSAYMWFCSDERPKVRAEMPNARITEIAKELGRRWRQCPPNARAKYQEAAAADKARYQRQKGGRGGSKVRSILSKSRSRADRSRSSTASRSSSQG